jgi:hypothetical protein
MGTFSLYKRRNVGKYEDAKTTRLDIGNAERCNSGLGTPPKNRAMLTFRCGVQEIHLPLKKTVLIKNVVQIPYV